MTAPSPDPRPTPGPLPEPFPTNPEEKPVHIIELPPNQPSPGIPVEHRSPVRPPRQADPSLRSG